MKKIIMLLLLLSIITSGSRCRKEHPVKIEQTPRAPDKNPKELL